MLGVERLSENFPRNEHEDFLRRNPRVARIVRETLEAEKELLDSENAEDFYDGSAELDLVELEVKIEKIISRLKKLTELPYMRKGDSFDDIETTISLEDLDKKCAGMGFPSSLSEEDFTDIYGAIEYMNSYSEEVIIASLPNINSPLLLSVIYAYADENDIYNIKGYIIGKENCPRWILSSEGIN